MKQLKADVVIIGSGTAGMAAVVAAAERGASVIAVERAGRTGGTANMASGLFAVESRLQRLRQLPLTREEAFKTYMNFTHWRVNARLVKAFIDKSADTIDWLEKMGVEFSNLSSHGVGNNPTQHTVKGPENSSQQAGRAATMMKILTDRAKELGAQILLKTTVKKILKEGGRVAGVIAGDKSGEDIQVKARAAIIATGGFSAGAFPGQAGSSGGGIRMAREVGAATKEVNEATGDHGPSGPPIGFFSGLGIAFWQPSLMVNLLGERFMNEEIVVGTVFERNAISTQKNAVAFTIFDEATKQHYVETGFDFIPGGVQVPVTKADNFDAELEETLAKGSDSIFVADSPEELADKAGINPKGLRETIDEYNKACETGRDELFNKNPRYLRSVKQPRFYAGKKLGDSITGWNGVKINYKTEVLTEDYEVIPGLYATGMDAACNVYYDTYPMVLPATAMGFAINSGRMAGENAASFALKK
jgi:fumarate reductase flavoprotein subunit